MSGTIIFLLALLPIATVFLLLVVLERSAKFSMLVAYLVTVLTALFVWGTDYTEVLGATVNGVVTAVTGNTCKRGDSYARKECVAPARTVTGTVRCIGGLAPVVSVRTEGEVPKEKVFDVAHALNTALAHLPIAAGDVVIPDVCGTGINVIATKSAK